MIVGSIAPMALSAVALTIAIGVVVVALTAAVVAALGRLLARIDTVEPAWWPEFERQFADYVAHG